MLSAAKTARPSGGYTISRSVRLRSSASAYFNRTPASAGSQTTWTWSAWFKRGLLTYGGSGAVTSLFGWTSSVAGQSGEIGFSNSALSGIGDNLFFAQGASTYRITNAVFRDPSAWYHIVVVWDSTNATDALRARIYINGVLQTYASAPSIALNTTLLCNSATAHTLAADPPNGGSVRDFFDGYLTEINFIDGQALTPSSFGAYNSTTGVWQPARYTGTYGTNGFYLTFADNSAATAAAIGKDYSGNGNNWTPNNISVTSGVTYDSMTDVPTLTSATAANYCTLNPLSNDSTNTLSAANLNYSIAANASGYPTSTFQFSSGKWYWECTVTSTHNIVGIVIGTTGTTTTLFSTGYGYYYTGNKYVNGVSTAYGASFTTNDVIGVAVDLDSGTPTITFYKNGTSQGAITIAAGTYKVGGGNGNSAATATGVYNFGQRPFAQSVPSGYLALNTQNLPVTTITNGAQYMAVTTYTGNGTSLTVSNGNNTTIGTTFKPDFIWIKDRSNARSNVLQNSVTGAAQYLISDSTGAEATASSGVTAINSNGFTVGTQLSWNGSAETYVAWQWQAGQGTTSSNTSGSITSTVSVNATAGFSVVTYTGTGANATVGHGLGVAPKMLIVKNRSAGSTNWCVYHSSLTSAAYSLFLDNTNAQGSFPTVWNSTAPTSTVFSLGTNLSSNGSTNSMVAYCWSEVAGFSKFGSYTGNGSSDGPFVYCGFRPRWILWKRSDGVGDWILQDTSRSTYNASDTVLYPNLSSAEGVGGGYPFDVLSNGFKMRNSATYANASGGTYIYAAFAENPFRYSLAR